MSARSTEAASSAKPGIGYECVENCATLPSPNTVGMNGFTVKAPHGCRLWPKKYSHAAKVPTKNTGSSAGTPEHQLKLLPLRLASVDEHHHHHQPDGDEHHAVQAAPQVGDALGVAKVLPASSMYASRAASASPVTKQVEEHPPRDGGEAHAQHHHARLRAGPKAKASSPTPNMAKMYFASSRSAGAPTPMGCMPT
jgi:hypothetical protein